MIRDGFFKTSDGVELYYKIVGEGRPLVFLPGFGQSLDDFDKNYNDLKSDYQIHMFDYRGHGKSQTPDYGYHIERYAKDFEEFIAFSGLDHFSLVAHSMGNAVAWCYFSLFGQTKVDKYILEDEAPCMVCDPEWNLDERLTYTGLFQATDIWTPLKSELLALNSHRGMMQLRLLRDHLGRDWRDIVKTIKIPTTIVMGATSHFGSELLWNWLESNIANSRLVVFTKKENGGHDMHSKNPEKFNQLVRDFFGGK